LILGCGYVGTRLAQACLQRGFRVSGSSRSDTHARHLSQMHIEGVVADQPAKLADDLLASVTHLVDSIPLSMRDSGLVASQADWLPRLTERCSQLRWAAYLSSTGVYGDAAGAWVNEDSMCQPDSQRGQQRLIAEAAWLNSGLPAEVFRLAGIYGPERNIINKLQAGDYKAVQWQPPHASSRIHVDDIVTTLLAAIEKPRPGRILNVADDLPLPHADYVQEVAALIGAPAPLILTPAEGEQYLSAAALSFFRDNKRIDNHRLKHELGISLKYPTFRHAFEKVESSLMSV